AAFEDVVRGLQDRIDTLDGFQRRHEERASSSARDENLGLLGSAEKRLAELYFPRASHGDDPASWMSLATQALHRAQAWYERSFTGNLSHHWSGVQSLALEAALTGRIKKAGQWYAAVEAAETDTRKEK